MRALEAFLRDVYGARRIVADGVLPAAVIDEAPGWNRLGTLAPRDAVRIAVAGIDLVRDRADRWLVLEDNLRVPSGIGYAITSRRLIRSVFPDLEPPAGVVGLEGVAGLLRGALLSATEPDEPGHDEVALLSAGPVDSAFYEHRLLADRMGVPVVTPRELQVTDDGVFLVGEGGRRRLAALYRRIDERALLTAKGADLRPVGSGGLQRRGARAGRAAQRDGQRRGRRQGRLRLRPRHDLLLPGRGAAARRTCRPTRASIPTAAPRCSTGSTSSS